MKKNEFIITLRQKLSCLPDKDIDRSVDYYKEIIEDCIEEGMSEEDAVNSLGDLDIIISAILSEVPEKNEPSCKNTEKRRMSSAEIILLILGSPLWLSLLIAAASLVISFFIVLAAAVISIYAVDISLIACGVAGIAVSAVLPFTNNLPAALCFLGMGLISSGIAILLFIGSNKLAKLIVLLIKNTFTGIIKIFKKRRTAK